ncbi:MAG: methionyl-tRNA formyltransferase [Bacteroidota bacterium]|nr:methionyl-tRNA formyltransferase [Bacteroidota bacterium]
MLRIVFMGTPDFAVASLDILLKNKFNIVGVITAPDKPAGRGRNVQESAVKKYAVKNGLKVLQPEKLKDENFLEALHSLKADLQVVVAFRMLPEVVWNMPSKGTLNLHASLLPQYRGAAPINWAIINGEENTGVTTFFLQHEIDTGDIIFQEKVNIADDETAGELHDKLMEVGAKVLLKTVNAINDNDFPQTKQQEIIKEEQIKHAPKIFKEDCKINWDENIESIYNKIRGLSPYPCAYTELFTNEDKTIQLKIFFATKEFSTTFLSPGSIHSDGKTFLKIAGKNGLLNITDLQLAGKNRMKTIDFLRGFNINSIKKAL